MGRSPISLAIAAAARREALSDFPPTPLHGVKVDAVVMVGWAPAPALSVNATNGKHFRGALTNKLAWEAAGAGLAQDYAKELAPFRGCRVRLTLALPTARPGAADGANYASGVSAKAFVDGITRTGLLIPDDNQKWCEVAAVMWTGGPTKDEVRVKVEVAPPLPDPAGW